MITLPKQKGEMVKLFILLLMLGITGYSLIMGLRKRKPQFLLLPVLSLLIYFIIQIAIVPAPFLDTVKFIFSLS